MDGNSSLERRYSFNMAQGIPVADSTHLNGSGFSWGSSLNPKQRSNSSFCLSNSHNSTVDINNRSIAVSPKSKNVSKIDARIAADVQSKGLASRIVKYHESGTRLNRSMSAHNLYSKPGQFPVVTLKKTELPYRATKQELSMIRIPPPEKSSFYGNTISSLLRSSSVVGLQSKRTEDLSGENRPILHPPPTEDDMAPTRSVLDVLKEISRKRINNDDSEADETSKKYCSRTTNDFVDIGNSNMPAISSNYTASASSCQRYKRQRDCITPQQITENKTSPEQAKKRVCSYNNDITSSLSSSMKYKPSGSSKRSSVSYNLNQTLPTNLESYEIQKNKMQRYIDHHNNDKNNTRVDVRFNNLENTLRNGDSIQPITPIPATPCTQEKQSEGVAPKRTVSEPVYNPERKIEINSVQPANKPRLTLFNKKVETVSSTINESNEAEVDNTNGFDDFGECAGIPFVKPKKISSITGLRNPVIERTQKSKLALMLSGLRGELYQNSETDVVDSPKGKSPPTEEAKPNIVITTITSSIQQSTSTVTTLTTAKPTNIEGVSTAPNTFNLSKTTPESLNISSNKTTSPLVGLKLTQSSSVNATTSTTINTTKTTEASNIPKIPVLGGFSFGANNASATSTSVEANTTTSISTTKEHKTTIATTTSSVTPTNTNLLNFGTSKQLTLSSSEGTDKIQTNLQTATKENSLEFPSVGTAFTLPTKNTTSSTSTATSATTSTFTFGKTVTDPAPAGSITNPTTSNSVKSNNSFNFSASSTSVPNTVFGTVTTSSTSVNTTTSSYTANTGNVGFTFGSAVASTNSTASTTSFTFNTTKPTTKINETPTNTSSGPGNSSISFSFGSNATSSVPAFGTNTNTALKPQLPTSGFSFSSDTKIQSSPSVDPNKSTALKQPETNVFSFESTKPTSTMAVATPMFGSTDNNLSNVTTSIFGTNSKKPEAATFGSIVENKTSTTAVFGANSVTVFGASADNKTSSAGTTSVFGGSTGSINNSSTSTPFSFGSKPANTQTSNTNNINNTTGGFSFGSAASNNSQSAPFAFGAKTSTTTSTSVNTFGGASSTSGQNTNFSFGSSANKSDNPPNIFSAPVNKPTENVSSSGGFSFGSALSPKTGNLSFGSSSGSAINTNNSTSGFSFGSAIVSKPNEVLSGSTAGFSFGGAAASKPNELSTGSTSGFSFGGATGSKPNEVSTGSSTGFSFGGATTTKPSETNINKPFSFGTPQSQQQQQPLLGSNNAVNPTNIFGVNSSTKTAPPPAFNFNAGNSTNIQSNSPVTNNIFAPQSSTITTGPGDRLIRRATRRLQK